jgi:hypothetical protein
MIRDNDEFIVTKNEQDQQANDDNEDEVFIHSIEEDIKQYEMCHSTLLENDSIMAKDIHRVIASYIKLHNMYKDNVEFTSKVGSSSTTCDVLGMLVNGYVGYGKLTHMICDWIILASLPVEGNNKEDNSQNESKTGLNENSSMTSLTTTIASITNNNSHTLDDYNKVINLYISNLLSSLITSKFNINYADSLITLDSTPPLWLWEMFEKREWRLLLLNLYAKYNQSILLGFCVKEISKKGYTRYSM